MHVRVLFFGQLKEIVGRAVDDVDLADGARVEELFARYGAKHPQLVGFRGSVVASVNQEFADWQSPLAGGDEVAFLPRLAGALNPPWWQGARISVNWCGKRFQFRILSRE